MGALRVGSGYDIHRLVPGRKLVLGGVEVPFDKGLLGHSDADVICHTVADALLGAASLGDIGRHFPDTDHQYKDASSLDLLSQVVEMLHQAGYRPVNIDATLVMERPKIAPLIPRMVDNLSRTLGIFPDLVSIKGKTAEGLDGVGRGEAVACYAVALVEKIPVSD